MAQQSMSANGVMVARASGRKKKAYTRRKLRAEGIRVGRIEPTTRELVNGLQPRRYNERPWQ